MLLSKIRFFVVFFSFDEHKHDGGHGRKRSFGQATPEEKDQQFDRKSQFQNRPKRFECYFQNWSKGDEFDRKNRTNEQASQKDEFDRHLL